MNVVINNVSLSEQSGNYFREVAEGLYKEDKNCCSDVDVVNYVFEVLAGVEKVLNTVAQIDDPVDFIKGVADGSIIIVKK